MLNPIHSERVHNQEIYVTRSDEFVRGAMVTTWEHGIGMEKTAKKQYEYFVQKGINKVSAAILVNMHPIPNLPLIGWDRSIKYFQTFKDGGFDDISAAFLGGSAVNHLSAHKYLIDCYKLAQEHVDDKTIAAVRTAVAPGNLNKKWAMQKAAEYSEVAKQLGVKSDLAASILGSRHINVVSPPLKQMVECMLYLQKELSITEETAALMTIEPIGSDGGLGRYLNPGGFLDLIRSKSIQKFKDFKT
jgi:hypothetical protein